VIRPSVASRLGRILLIVFGLGFMLIAVRYFVDPALLTAETGVAIPSVKAMMEIRTVYGGMFFGIGLTTLFLGLRRATLGAGLWVLILTAGSVAVARVAAILLGQAPDALFTGLLATEIVGVLLAIIALRGLMQGGSDIS